MAKMTAEDKKWWENEMTTRHQQFVTTIVLWYVLLIIVVLVFLTNHIPGGMGLLVVYTLLSFKQVAADELSTVLLFGRPSWQLKKPGLAFAPLGICSIRTDPRGHIQLEIGTPTIVDPEGIVRPMTTQERENAVNRAREQGIFIDSEPMRITFGTAKTANYGLLAPPELKQTGKEAELGEFITDEKAMYSDRTSDPLNERLTPDPHLTLIWEIEHHPAFLQRIGSIDLGNQFIRRATTSALQEIAGQTTPAIAIRHLDVVNRHITYKTELRVGEYENDKDPESMKTTSNGNQESRYPWVGINFINAQINTWGLPKRVNVAQANAREAGYTAEGTVTASQAERQRLINTGEGTATARKALLMAEADGRKALAEATKSEEGQLLAYLETLRTALEKSQHSTIFGPELFNAVGGVSKIVDEIKKRSPASGPKELPQPASST
jgi:hypothetical protein